MPLLSRKSESESPGRIIWTTSIETTAKNFTLGDFQGIHSLGPYESSKRLTDILVLTCTLPGVAPYSSSYFDIEGPDHDKSHRVRPKVYVTHPGLVVSSLFPLTFVLQWLYWLGFLMCRYLGSPWHGVDGYRGAYAPAWVALQDQSRLDAIRAERVKWGSCSDRLGRSSVKMTEVEHWGWQGTMEDRESLASDTSRGLQRKLVGRKTGAPYMTKERREEFEVVGAECWKRIENLRIEWEERLRIGSVGDDSGKGSLFEVN